MAIGCSAYGCTNRHGKQLGVSFYRFPADGKKRAQWIAAMRRENWVPNATSRLCSEHFISGQKSNNPMSPDYVPSIFSFVSSSKKRQKVEQLQQFDRRQNMKRKKGEHHNRSVCAEALLSLTGVTSDVTPHDNRDCNDSLLNQDSARSALLSDQPGSCDKSIEQLKDECNSLKQEVFSLRARVKSLTMDEDAFKNNDQKVKDLTGLSTYCVMRALLVTIQPFLKEKTVLSPFQQLLLTCMRLRCNISMQLTAYLFSVSRSTVSRVFNDVLHLMDRRLVPALVVWPCREQLRLSMPYSFRQTFRKCACIIDCFEIFIERASDLRARAQTYSSYKSHNTMKYLIGITPQGTISYISKGWGGRTSDKHVSNNCGFLDNLIPGDVILADRGFNIEDSVGLHNCELKIPAFTKGKKQLDPLDVETTRALASQRIHVERVIGLTRRKFTMLESTIPITYLQSDQFKLTTLDKIVRVACALTNLSESVVVFD